MIPSAFSINIRVPFYHFRAPAGHEVDIVLEGPAKKVVGIEVKASTTIDDSGLAGLKKLKEIAGKDFLKGIVLYTGEKTLPFGKDGYILPINALWDV